MTPVNSVPRIGEVICHAYLWRNRADRGQTEGTKEPPCVVVHLQKDGDDSRVYVVPITHTKPFDNERSLLFPDATKKRLRLVDQPSWIITSELNHFKWPGFDVRRTPDDRDSFGLLPNKLTVQAIGNIKDNANHQSLSAVNRDE